MRVEAYRNLRRNAYSVRALEGRDKGRVILHKERLKVVDADLIVQEAGNRKVRETGQKNVHAFVRGEMAIGDDAVVPEGSNRMSYNPYENVSFVDSDTGMEIGYARSVYLTEGGVFYE